MLRTEGQSAENRLVIRGGAVVELDEVRVVGEDVGDTGLDHWQSGAKILECLRRAYLHREVGQRERHHRDVERLHRSREPPGGLVTP